MEVGQKGNSIGLGHLKKARAFVQANNILYNVIEDSEIGKSGYTKAHLRKLKTSDSEADIRFLAGARGCENENNDSLVVLVRYKEAAYLFVGDAETKRDPICTAEVCAPGKPIFRDITEAIFCTCWDKDIRVTYQEGTEFSVETGPGQQITSH